MKKNLLLLGIVFTFLLACSNIERDNLLDPKNSESYRQKIILIESFINTNSNAPAYNFMALEALDSLAQTYGKTILTLHYHRHTSQYNDPLADAAAIETEAHYSNYTTDYTHQSGRKKGVPDLFVNGPQQRVQGASSVSNVITRLSTIVSNENIEKGYYTIEPEVEISNGTLSGLCRVARLGNRQASNLILKIILTQNQAQNGARSVVKVVHDAPIAKIEAGAYLERKFTINNMPEANHVLFVLSRKDNGPVLHSVEVQL